MCQSGCINKLLLWNAIENLLPCQECPFPREEAENHWLMVNLETGAYTFSFLLLVTRHMRLHNFASLHMCCGM